MFAFLMTKETLTVFGAQTYNAQWQGICAVTLAFKILRSAAPRELMSIVDLTGKGQRQHQGRSSMNNEVGEKHHELFFCPLIHIFFFCVCVATNCLILTLYLNSVKSMSCKA